ncbi:MAG: hypothetical protein CMJ77_15350 [Planctomycetaceae bacterium]|nr:hypothetical protein [Planctomycetaceae bacterium]
MEFRTRRNLGRILTVLVIALSVLGTNLRSGFSSEHDERLVKGLLERALYAQARLLCQDAIGTYTDNAQRQADWYGLLFRTYADEFLNSPPEQQTKILADAERDWQNFAASSLRPSRPDVELTYLLIGLAEGELLSLTGSHSQDPDVRRRALQRLRSSSEALQTLQKSVAQLQRTAAAGRHLSDFKLRQLLYQTQFKLGESLKAQALIYPIRSPDQVHLLSEAQREFNSMSRLSGTSTLKSRSQLAEIDCQLRLGNLDQARQSIERIEQDSLSQELKDELKISEAEFSMKQGQPQTAVRRINEGLLQRRTDLSAAVHAKAELTLLRAFLAIARQATEEKNTELANQYQTLAINLVGQMEQTHNSYWVAIANRQLTGLSAGNVHSSDLEILVRAATTQFQQGRVREASATYRKAASLARELSDASRAFDLRLRAAAIELQQKDYKTASAALRELALTDPKYQRSSEAHLLAINATATLARQSSSAFPDYEELLREHLRHWKTGQSADTVRKRLGQIQFVRGELQDASDSWLLVDDSFVQIAEVRGSLNRCFQQMLTNPKLEQSARDQIANRAANYFLSAAEKQREAEDDWNVNSRQLLARHATFQLLYSSEVPRPLIRLLQSAAASPNASPQEKATLESLIGLNQALLGQFDAAVATFNQVTWPLVDRPVDILSRLDEAAQEQQKWNKPITQIILHLNNTFVQSLEPFSEDDEYRRSRYEAAALKRAGNGKAALQIYRRLATQQPRNVAILTQLAQLLSSDPTEGSQKSALKTWRTVVRLTSSGSPKWLEAKLGIANSLWALGDYDRAQEVAKLTTVLHPNMRDPRLKRGFESLLERAPSP